MSPLNDTDIGDGEPQPSFSVRFTPRAETETGDAAERLAEITGSLDLAMEWFFGVKVAAGTLATNPRRYPIDTDVSRKLGREIRRMLFQRSVGSAAYHLYYNVEDTSDDGPVVRIVHIRHASRKPITRIEAKGFQKET